MGDIINFPAMTSRTHPAGHKKHRGSAQILLFTGVQYLREDTNTEKCDDGTKTPGGGSRLRRRKGLA